MAFSVVSSAKTPGGRLVTAFSSRRLPGSKKGDKKKRETDSYMNRRDNPFLFSTDYAHAHEMKCEEGSMRVTALVTVTGKRRRNCGTIFGCEE